MVLTVVADLPVALCPLLPRPVHEGGQVEKHQTHARMDGHVQAGCSLPVRPHQVQNGNLGQVGQVPEVRTVAHYDRQDQHFEHRAKRSGHCEHPLLEYAEDEEVGRGHLQPVDNWLEGSGLVV